MAVDVGCGKAINRRHFFNPSYTGVDFKEEFISIARMLYPKDNFSICNLSEESPPLGDLLVCTLVLNNKHYPKEKTLEGVINLVSSVKPGGVLIFTLAESNYAYEGDVDDYLYRYFSFVRKNKYGRFNSPSYFSFPIAWAMLFFRGLRLDSQNRMSLYICRGKIG